MHNNRIEIKINATTVDNKTSAQEREVASLINMEGHDITMDVSVNEQQTKAIIDTGSPVTVISKRLFDRMNKTFNDGDASIETNLIKTSVRLYSCEAEKAVYTMGECNFLLIHKGSKCVSSVMWPRIWPTIAF